MKPCFERLPRPGGFAIETNTGNVAVQAEKRLLISAEELRRQKV